MEFDSTFVIAIVSIAIFLIVFLWLVINIIKTLRRLNQNLELLPGVIMNLKTTSERANETLETANASIKNLNSLVEELKILPKIIAEVGESLKEFEVFLKGQIEVLKDDVHFTIEDSRAILSDLKKVSSEVQTNIDELNKAIHPLIKNVKETAETGSLILLDLNKSIKTVYVEASALTAGLTELLSGLKKILGFKKT